MRQRKLICIWQVVFCLFQTIFPRPTHKVLEIFLFFYKYFFACRIYNIMLLKGWTDSRNPPLVNKRVLHLPLVLIRTCSCTPVKHFIDWRVPWIGFIGQQEPISTRALLQVNGSLIIPFSCHSTTSSSNSPFNGKLLKIVQLSKKLS